MRKISFKEYNIKRKKAKLDFLKIRDNLEQKPDKGLRTRDESKQNALYQAAINKRNRLMQEGILEKVGERKYKINF
ncbi:hypothetical protein [Selenihalanaerobacter shriftii]|nr:hypothetical protein [Selenihalanaerobacter shriftii]